MNMHADKDIKQDAGLISALSSPNSLTSAEIVLTFNIQGGKVVTLLQAV